MKRTLGGWPLWVWIAVGGAALLGGVWYLRRKQASAASPQGQQAAPASNGQPLFSQQQELQDFGIFQSLTQAQQGSDVQFLSEVASLFGGGGASASSPGSTVGGVGGFGGGSAGSPVGGTGQPAGVPGATQVPGGSLVPAGGAQVPGGSLQGTVLTGPDAGASFYQGTTQYGTPAAVPFTGVIPAGSLYAPNASPGEVNTAFSETPSGTFTQEQPVGGGQGYTAYVPAGSVNVIPIGS